MVRQADRTAASVEAITQSARELFAKVGFHDVTIEQIAERAGVAKGSVYYHFASKLHLFDHVLNALQGELAAQLARSARSSEPTPQSMAAGIRAYLIAANRPSIKRILLIDGPVALGWKRWREIDDKYFAHVVRGGLAHVMGPSTTRAQLDSATSLVMGTIMEAALASGASRQPSKTAALHTDTIARLLSGLSS